MIYISWDKKNCNEHLARSPFINNNKQEDYWNNTSVCCHFLLRGGNETKRWNFWTTEIRLSKHSTGCVSAGGLWEPALESHHKPSCSSGRPLLSEARGGMSTGMWETTPSVRRILKNTFQKSTTQSAFWLKSHVVSLEVWHVLNRLLLWSEGLGTWKSTPVVTWQLLNIASILKTSLIYYVPVPQWTLSLKNKNRINEYTAKRVNKGKKPQHLLVLFRSTPCNGWSPTYSKKTKWWIRLLYRKITKLIQLLKWQHLSCLLKLLMMDAWQPLKGEEINSIAFTHPGTLGQSARFPAGTDLLVKVILHKFAQLPSQN